MKTKLGYFNTLLCSVLRHKNDPFLRKKIIIRLSSNSSQKYISLIPQTFTRVGLLIFMILFTDPHNVIDKRG